MPSGANFLTSTYAYELPPQLIAQSPAQRRDSSRLLVLPAQGQPSHIHFSDLPSLLRPGDVVVANDTKVLAARFFPKRRKGGAAEVLLLHPADEPETWVAMARPGKRVRAGDRLTLGPNQGIEVVGRAEGGLRLIRFYGIDAVEAMKLYGKVPLPPYIRTPPPDARERYQTVYAHHDGSVAAPTAGLHFTESLIDDLKNTGMEWVTITLRVGAGTFRPVKTEDVREHQMHAESYTIAEDAAHRINAAKTSGRRIVAVGTTALRALEDAALNTEGQGVAAGSRWTSLFIYPPYDFRIADVLITNFHLPRSTLLMLVCAFAGTQRVLTAYEEAVRLNYRFYSFGDAMFVEG